MFIGNNKNVISPCIGQCGLDENDICIGCYRSAVEISTWMDTSINEKIKIVDRCKKQIALNTKIIQ
jgi:predicted Fe-S protein YdhL (DUF1289 family)